MKITLVRGLLFVGALCALAIGARAQVIELRGTINAAQENPATSSTATGSAIMLYDVAANTFDLVVSISGMTNLATASHIHEGAAGVNGGVVTNLGADAVYVRSGSTLTQTFRGITHGGDKLKLIQGGTYFNIHSAQFPGGEVRGQLIARPIRLVANLDVAQEAAAFPALNFTAVNNFGAAVFVYDPTANTISIRHSLYNYSSTFTNSHLHTGGPGVSGPVHTQLGTSATAGAYNSTNGVISGSHDAVPYAGNPIELLTGLNYINYHSQAFTGGQLRGQVTVSNETVGTRMGNLSTRGFVGPGDQVLIGGISIQGAEPVRLLITAKGPSLTAFGVAGALANPRLALFDSAGRQIAINDDIGVTTGTELARIPGAPTIAVESALVVVLPPGNYTAQVSSASGTGIAIVEAYDLRNLPTTLAIASLAPARAASPVQGFASVSAKNAQPELCVAAPLVVVAVR
ncbi:MAG: CHRD domain-containing protein [Opitutaceae bacterium]